MTEVASRWAEIADRRVRVPEHVAHRSFAHQTVMLNLRTSQYHGLDAVGARFLEALSAQPDARAAVAELAVHYGQPPARIESDLTEFVLALADRGLLELGDGAT